MAKNQTLQHKRSTDAGKIPTTSQVAVGELALNLTDKSIYTKTPSNVIIQMARDVVKSATQPTSQPPVNGSLWYNTTDDVLLAYNGTQWVPSNFAGLPVLPANTTATPTWTSGSGTQASPYVFAITVTPGDIALVTTIVVTGLAPGQLVPITDLNSATNGGRFSFTNSLADGGGILRCNVIVTDLPASAPGVTLSALIRIGTATVYLSATASMASSFPQAGVSFPTGIGSSATSWTAPADSLTSTGDIEISIDSSTWSQGPLAITGGDTLYTRWSGAAGSGTGIDSVNGSTITGSVVEASNGSSVSSSLVVDKIPDVISFISQTGVAQGTDITSNVVTIDGVNSYLYLTSTNTVSARINGGAFTSVPSIGTSLFIEDGQTLELRQTSSNTSNTATTVTVSVGGGSAAFTVTTISAGIVTPSVTSPINGSTGISTSATITSSAYAVVGSVGTHLNSDWEISSDSGFGTIVASSMASTTNLTSWVPTGLSNTTQYWVRVRYRSNDGVVSDYSPAATWTTGVQPGFTWTSRSPGSPSANWNGVTLGNSLFVIVGDAGAIRTSPDLTTWSAMITSGTANWADVTWGNGLFVTVGSGGAIRTSSDGDTWTSRSSGTTNQLDGVTWGNPGGNGLFVAVGDGGTIRTSSDGTTWTSRTSGTSINLNDVTWGNSLFVAVGGDGTDAVIRTSSDGITWTTRSTISATDLRAVTWAGTQFIAVGGTGEIRTSPTGTTWSTQPTAANGVSLPGVAWGASLFVVISGGGNTFNITSPDGITWTRSANLGFSDKNDIIWTGTMFIIVGDDNLVRTSP